MAKKTTAPRVRQRRRDSGRYPRTLVLVTTAKQDDEVRAHADLMGSSINEVMRQAIAAGMPILRRRAREDGALSGVA